MDETRNMDSRDAWDGVVLLLVWLKARMRVTMPCVRSQQDFRVYVYGRR